ncbi:MAG: hypothetical protein KME17_15490 [Cyanosarcina radialis HA8281-LM2]|jgi:hypothetical protein|nr:hypothetical protein [Cyanosarcina radialis HA8281-LM2]
MSNNSKPSTKEELFVALVTVIIAATICGAAIFGFSILWKEGSRSIANPTTYRSSWRF